MNSKQLDPNRTNGYIVPTPQANHLASFAKYVEICQTHNKKMYIELKQPSQAGIVPEYDQDPTHVYAQEVWLTGLVDIITNTGVSPSALNDAVFISFDHQILV
jgi:hypothetical protein